MKTKNISNLFIAGTMIFIAFSCSLDYDPISEYSERTYGQTSSTDSIKYENKS